MSWNFLGIGKKSEKNESTPKQNEQKKEEGLEAVKMSMIKDEQGHTAGEVIDCNGEAQLYCVKCKDNKIVNHYQKAYHYNKKRGVMAFLRAKCPVCGTGMSRILGVGK